MKKLWTIFPLIFLCFSISKASYISDDNNCLNTFKYIESSKKQSFSIAPIDINIPSNINANCGEVISIPVTVTNFDDINLLELSLNWDQNVIQYQSIVGFTLPNLDISTFNTSQTSNGILSLQWSNNIGVTKSANSIIFTINFVVIGTNATSSNIQFVNSPIALNATHSNGSSETLNPNSGIVSVSCSGSAHADVAFQAPDNMFVNCGETIIIPIQVFNFTNIGSFQIDILWDQSQFTFSNFINPGVLTEGYSTNSSNAGAIFLQWTGISLRSVPNGTTLFYVELTSIGSNSDNSAISFNNAFASNDITFFPLITDNGDVTTNCSSSLTLSIPTVTDVGCGATFSVPITVQDFTNMDDLSFKLTWDPTVLDYQGVLNFTIPGSSSSDVTVMASAGMLNFVWERSGTPVTVSDGTILFEVEFAGLSGGGSSDIIISDGVAQNTDTGNMLVLAQNGIVNEDCSSSTPSRELTLITSTQTVPCGTIISVPITVENFTLISGVQFDFLWDTADLTFQSISNQNSDLTIGALNFNLGMTNSGSLRFAWAGNDPETLNDGTVLFTIDFMVSPTASGLISNLTFIDHLATINVGGVFDEYTPALTNGSITAICDDTPPTFTNCPNSFSINGIPPNCTATATWTPPTATDDSGGTVMITSSHTPPVNLPIGITTITYTATDEAGNPTICQFIVTVTDNVNAGANNSTSICNNNSSFDLTSLLSGNAQSGGTWTETSMTSSGVNLSNPTDIDFSMVASGSYTFEYTVSPCTASDVAIMTIMVENEPNAGTNNSTTLCNDVNSFDLTSLLSGNAQSGGTWTETSMTSSGVNLSNPSNINFSGVSAGNYTFTYTVSGNVPCNTSSTVTISITITEAPNAGNNNTQDVCNTETNFNLISLLSGNAQSGGTWAETTNSGINISNPTSVDFSGISTGTYVFTYTVEACASNDIAELTIQLRQEPNAGADNSQDICNTETDFDLTSLLSGNAQSGGTWTETTNSGVNISNPTSVNFSGINAGTYIFTYGVTSTSPCTPLDLAIITIEVKSLPNAGNDNSDIEICNIETDFDLTSLLSGNAQSGGTWAETTNSGVNISNPTSVDFTGILTGEYVFNYTVESCGTTDIATFTIDILDAPNAGSNNSDTVCNDVNNFNLTTLLLGADTGGTWAETTNSGIDLSNPSNVDFSGISAGNYEFTYSIESCGTTDVALISITIPSLPNAGNDNEVSFCTNENNFDLFTTLSTNADTNGTWTETTSSGVDLSDPNNVDFSSVSLGTYDFVYSVNSCSNTDNANITLNIIPLPNAGEDNMATVCTDETNYNITALLSSSADVGGTWTETTSSGVDLSDPININFSGTTTGTYVFNYTVENCGTTDIAIFNITVADDCVTPSTDLEIIAPTTNADCNTTITVPITVRNFTLLDGLGFVVEWNPTVLSYQGINNFNTVLNINSINFNLDSIGVGELNFIWADSTPRTLSDNDILFVLTFNVITTMHGAMSQINFISDNGITFLTSYNSGLNEYEPNPINGLITIDCDLSPPMIENCPNDISQNTDPGQCNAVVTWTEPTATDDVNIATFTSTHQPGDVFSVGTTTVTYTAIDDSGKETTCSFDVTITDTSANAGTDNTTTLCTKPSNFDLTSLLSSDAQSGGSWTETTSSGVNISDPTNVDFSNLSTGNYEFTYIIGGPSSCTTDQAIISIILDNEQPVITNCPTDINLMVNLSSTTCEAIANWTVPDVTDNCNIVSFISSHNNGSSFPIGITTVTYTAIDEIGNEAICSFNVTVSAIITEPSDIVVCEGDEINLNVENISGATYFWNGPNNYTSGGASPSIFNASEIHVGTYTVTVTSSTGCMAFADVEVSLSNEITNIEIDKNDPILCADGTQTLTLSENGGEANQWQWYDPNGTLISSTAGVTVSNVTGDDAGFYRLAASSPTGCVNDTMILVEITAKPNAPNLIPDKNVICLGETVTLTGLLYNVPNITYNWGSSDAVNSGLVSVQNNETFATPATTGTYTYFYSVTINGCTSQIAETDIIVQDAVPLDVSSNAPILCTDGSETLQLSASIPGNANSWEWSGPDGFSSTIQNPTISNANPDNAGTYTVEVQTESGCFVTGTVNVEITTKPSSPELTANKLIICQGETVTLEGTEYDDNTQYNWSASPTTGSGLIVNNDNIISVTPTIAGNFIYSYSVTTNGCTTDVAQVTVNVSPVPAPPTITTNEFICEGDNIELLVPNTPGATYQWSGPNGFSSTIHNPTIVDAGIENVGSYSVSVQLGDCNVTVSEPVFIDILSNIEAVDDDIDATAGEITTFNVLPNDVFNSNADITLNLLSNIPESEGILVYNNNGEFTYTPDEKTIIGQVSFAYEICYTICDESGTGNSICNTATVTISVTPGREECDIVPTIITPNGDNINDAFVIPCLATGEYPTNELTVFNQWGDVIFQALNYKNDWKGTYNNENVPDGTYYYIFRQDRTVEKPITGFLMIYR